MEEERYYDKCKVTTCKYIIYAIGIFFILCFIVGFVVGMGFRPTTYTYVYIIRINNSTDFDFYDFNRALCLESYFKNFPFSLVDIGYEYVGNISSKSEQTYTLYETKKSLGITVHKMNSQNYGGIKYDVNNNRIVVVAWDHFNIPKLAQYLGCKNCNSWNIDPTSNITDDSLFDMTLVLRFGNCGQTLAKCDPFEVYTISQNLTNSVIKFYSHSKDNKTTQYYDCYYNGGYNITKWYKN